MTTCARRLHIKLSNMRHGLLLASRVKPSGWAHATRLTYVPRQDLLRPCAPQFFITRQRRLLQSHHTPDDLKVSTQEDQLSDNDSKDRSIPDNSQNTETNPGNKPTSIKQVKDEDWIWKYAGDRIGSINGKALKGTEEYVSHSAGTRLLCSWTVAHGNERAIWVPGRSPALNTPCMTQNLAENADSAR